MVLTLPHAVRFVCAYDAAAGRAVRRILVRAVSGFYRGRGRATHAGSRLAKEATGAKTGAVVFEQRFDSGLRVNLHFHALWADGAFACGRGSGRATFHPHDEVVDADIGRLLRQIASRVRRWLLRHGRVPAQDGDVPADDPGAKEPTLLAELGAAAVQGRTAHGPRAGRCDERPGRGSAQRQAPTAGSLVASHEGFSLHAAVRIPQGCRAQLERLCRYAARPAVAEERLSLLPDGRVRYALKRRWRDGSTCVVLEPFTLLERLCALVPRPRHMLVTYHGVLAPAAGWRPRVVPPPPLPDADDPEGCRHVAGDRHGRRGNRDSRNSDRRSSDARDAQDAGEEEAATARPKQRGVPHAPRKPSRPRPRYAWAELLRRVFAIDVLTCPWCGGACRLLAAILDPEAIHRILAHLGLPTEPPPIAPARAPPDPPLPW